MSIPDSKANAETAVKSKMPDLYIESYGRLFMAVFILVAFSTFASWFALTHIKSNTREQLGSALQATHETTVEALHIWVEEKLHETDRWASSPEIRVEVEKLLTTERTPEALRAHPSQKLIRSKFAPFLSEEHYQGMFVIAPDYISIASMRDSNTGTANLLSGQKGFLRSVFAGESRISLPQLSDVPLNNHRADGFEGNAPTMFICSPVYNKAEEVIAVLAFRIDPERNFSRIVQTGRIGKSGDTYFLNRDGLLVTDSRFDDQLRRFGLIKPGERGMFSIQVRDPGGDMVKGFRVSYEEHHRSPLTLMAASVSRKQSGKNLEGYPDYRGVPVIGVWSWSSELRAGIATEIDYDEAYEPYHQMRQLTLLLFLMMGVLFFTLYTWIVRNNRRRQTLMQRINDVLHDKNRKLNEAMDAIDRISGIVPLCAWCGGKIQNEEGEWVKLEEYIEEHTEAKISHGMCPNCKEKVLSEHRKKH